MNARVAAARRRENLAHHALLRRSRLTHALRAVAIVTSVAMLYAVSYAVAYRWLELIGGKP